MLNSFIIRTTNLNHCFLQRVSNSLKFSQNNFSTGRKPNLKKSAKSQRTAVKEKMTAAKTQRSNSNSKRSFDGKYLLPACLTCFGLYQIIEEIYICKDLQKVSYTEFERDYLLHGEVHKVQLLSYFGRTFSKCSAVVYLQNDANRSYKEICIINEHPSVIRSKIDRIERDLKVNRKEAIPIQYSITNLVLFVAVVLTALTRFRSRGLNALRSATKYHDLPQTKKLEKPSQNDLYYPTILKEMKERMDGEYNKFRPKHETTFKDIAGLHNAKIEIQEFLQYLNNPSKFIKLGARLPKGAMLLGPPGCGKTLLVKALASEANVPFFYKSGPDFIDMRGGQAAAKLREVFRQASSSAPSIIFIDEIDAIGKTRGFHSGESDEDQTLNQLLVEMDGMESVAGVIVFAATNRVDILDKALIRPGRFDRHILVDYPVLEERKELFTLYLSKNQQHIQGSIKNLSDRLSLQTPGMTGADISNICNEAAVIASRMDYKTVTNECFDIALERVIAGSESKTRFLSESERKINAYHEAGHVLVGWMLKYADPILKVSIIPRTMGLLGFTQKDFQNKYLKNYDMLVDEISVLLGGRAAESITFDYITSGAENDLKKVSKLAFNMVREWGMSEKVGHFSFQVTEQDEHSGNFPFSKYTQALIETEANQIIVSAYKKAENVIKGNREKLEKIAVELLKKESLTFEDIETLIGPRPFGRKISNEIIK